MLYKNKEPQLIVISGPTGSGKTTICRRIVEESKEILFSISHTTRKKRPYEKDGVDYFFVSKEKFLELIEKKEFLEYAIVHNNYYGTHISQWLNAKEKGCDLILDIDVQGGYQVFKAFKNALLIFILPPSFEVLLERIRKREGEKGFDLKLRLKTALKELDFAKKYHYNIINGDLDKAILEVKSIIEVSRNRSFNYEEIRKVLKNNIKNYLR